MKTNADNSSQQSNSRPAFPRVFAAWLALVSLLFSGCANMSPGANAAVFGTGAAGLRILAGALNHEDMRYTVPQALAIGATVGYVAYVVAKHRATERQYRITAQRARIYHARVAHRTREKPRSRYIAVDAPRDENSTGETSVMIYDTNTQELVSYDVYDLRSRPQIGSVTRFEEYNAEYVAAGNSQ